jgi:hypothetical protein
VKNAHNPVRREGLSEQPHDAVPRDDHLMAQRLLAAFEYLRESTVLTDPGDRFLPANRAFRELNRNVVRAIWADAAPGRGATFWFTAPAAEKWRS